MKKYLLWLPVIFLICSSAIYNNKSNKKQQTVNRNISLVIYKRISYTSNVYNNTSAQLQITIEKVSGSKHDVVWDNAFDVKLLQAYPAMDSALIQTITVPGVNNGKEHFEVIYTRIYNSNGYELRIQNVAVINEDSGNRLDIGI